MNYDWRPHLTPAQILERGAFGHSYFNKATYADIQGLGLPLDVINANSCVPDLATNAYGVKSGMSLAAWKQNGWIFDEDPLGWFHWYCRFSAGRRHPRDAHQISRQRRYLAGMARSSWHRIPEAGPISRVALQSLIHWAYDPVLLFGDRAII